MNCFPTIITPINNSGAIDGKERNGNKSEGRQEKGSQQEIIKLREQGKKLYRKPR